VKYLTPLKEIKNSTQQITSLESDIQSVKKLPPLEIQCSKDSTTGKQPEPNEPTSYLVAHLLEILLFSIML